MTNFMPDDFLVAYNLTHGRANAMLTMKLFPPLSVKMKSAKQSVSRRRVVITGIEAEAFRSAPRRKPIDSPFDMPAGADRALHAAVRRKEAPA
jgi:hypothetical protein